MIAVKESVFDGASQVRNFVNLEFYLKLNDVTPYLTC